MRKKTLKKRVLLFWLLIFWILACVLTFVGLGDLPLRDFDEATVARVAFELSKLKGVDQFLPEIWGLDYLNKPPGVHWLISKVIYFLHNRLAIRPDLPSEFQIRFVPALLSTLIVPLGGLIQWSLLPKDRIAIISSSAILLTLLPIIRHGRLAMLDGPQLSAMALFWLFLISLDGTRDDKWKWFATGCASSFMLLMKAPLLLPTIAASLLPMILEFKNKKYLNLKEINWVLLGLMPGLFWHVFNSFQRGSGALWLWWGDGAGRVLFYPGAGSELGWRVPFIEMIEGGWPWLVLLPFGFLCALRDRKSRWGIWTLSIYGVLCLSIFPLSTQLPWYSHPLWLPMALLCSRPMAMLVHQLKPKNAFYLNYLVIVPYLWILLGLVLIFVGLLGGLDLWKFFHQYSLIALFAGLGWFIGGLMLLAKFKTKRLVGLFIVVLGSFASLICLMTSNFWLWELNEHWAVPPVAKLVSRTDVTDIALDYDFERPSLNWYAKRRIKTLRELPNAKWVITQRPNQFDSLKNRECKIYDTNNSWTLLSCSP